MFDAFDPVLLARIQFAFTIAVHIVFPALSIGLASYLAVLEALWLYRRESNYLALYRYWLRIFALTFGMGVVSGVVMSYQFGTNWGPFADAAGPILGPLLGYEVMTAFFLEAGFLGVMLFGMQRVGPRLHFFATSMVAIGTLMSAFWILAANSWMHTPAGFTIRGDQFIPVDWWQVVFNPSFPFRFVHMVIAAYLTTAFVVSAVGAFHLLNDYENDLARLMFSMAMWIAAIAAPLQLVAGDAHGLNTLKYQPAKIAAIEGHWESQRGAPLLLFGLPDMNAQETRYAIEIPHLGSLILTHEWNGELQGLKAWPRDERPYAPVLFWSFRLMVGIGLIMIAVGIISSWLRWRGHLDRTRWFLRCCTLMGPAGFLAITAGWITTEMGRQPYVVYGLMRTVDARSPIDAPAVAISLGAFVVVYFFVFGAGVYYLLRLMRIPPSPLVGDPESGLPQRAAGITPVQSLDPP